MDSLSLWEESGMWKISPSVWSAQFVLTLFVHSTCMEYSMLEALESLELSLEEIAEGKGDLLRTEDILQSSEPLI